MGDDNVLNLLRQEYSVNGPVAFRKAYDAMEAILQFNLKGTAEAANLVADKVSAAEQAMLGALVVSLIVGGVLIWLIPRSVIDPENQAVAVEQCIALC